MPFNPRRYNGVAPVDPLTLSPEAILKTDSGVFSDGGTTPAAPGDGIQQWVDQVNGHIFQQTVLGFQPDLTATADGLNGLSALSFDGSNDYLLCTTLPASIKTIITIHVPVLVNSNRTILGADTSDPVGIGAFYHKSADPGTPGGSCGTVFSENTSNSAQAAALGGSIDEKVWSVYSAKADDVAGQVTFFKGQAPISSASYTGTSRPVGGAGVAIGAGFFNGNVVDEFSGKIVAVYMFQDALTDEQIQGVVAHEEAAYDILPTGDYTFSCFNKEKSLLYNAQSPDGVNFKNRPINHFPNPATLGCRDPSKFYDPVADKYFICHTNADDPADECTNFVILESTDDITYTHVTYVDCSSIANGVLNYTWAPEWFKDPADGKVYILVSITPNGADVGAGGTPFGGYYLEALDPGVYSSWGLPQLLDTPDIQNPNAGGGFSGGIDWIMQVISGTYYLWYKDEGAAVNKYIYYATSTSLTGTFTSQVGPYAVPPGPDDWAGWGDNREGQFLLQLPNGDWRMYLDEIGINYDYSDSDDQFATWGALAPITDNFAFGQRQHGTVVLLPGVDNFDFTAQTDVPPATLIESNTVVPTGEAGTYQISISAGGQYSIDSAPFTSAPGNFTIGSDVKVNQTSSPDPLTLTTVSLTIGGTVADFDVTTAAAMAPDSLLVQTTISDATMTAGANSGVITPENYSAPGVLASSVPVDYYVRAVDENGTILVPMTSGVTEADGTLVIDNQSVGAVGNTVEVFIESGTKNITWQNQTVIDLDS
jgi:hypothetical protein